MPCSIFSFIWYSSFLLPHLTTSAVVPPTAELPPQLPDEVHCVNSDYPTPPPEACEALSLQLRMLAYPETTRIFTILDAPPGVPTIRVPYCFSNAGCQVSLALLPDKFLELSSWQEIAIQALIISEFCFNSPLTGPMDAGRAKLGQQMGMVALVSGPWGPSGRPGGGPVDCVRPAEGLLLGGDGEALRARNMTADVESLRAIAASANMTDGVTPLQVAQNDVVALRG